MSTKIRGHLITAVGWNQFNNSLTSTGPILMGTTRGLIFETEISTESTMFSTGLINWLLYFLSTEKCSTYVYCSDLTIFFCSTGGIEKQWKQLYDLGKGGQSNAITGLEYHRVPNSKRYFIFVTTSLRLYQFQVRIYTKLVLGSILIWYQMFWGIFDPPTLLRWFIT